MARKDAFAYAKAMVINMLTPREYQKLCKAKTLHGAYFFFGPEEYFKNRCLHLTREAFFGEEGDDPFGHIVISGEKPGYLEELAEQLSSFSLFSEKKLIELHSVDYDGLSDSEFERLAVLLEEQKSNEDAILILYAEEDEFTSGDLPKKPSKLFRRMDEVCQTVFFNYETPAALNAWICRHFAASGVAITPSQAEKLISFCSKDMSTLAHEAEKLICYTLSQERTEADEKDIPFVCFGKSIDGAFDFTDALMQADAARAVRLLTRMKAARVKPEIILAGVSDTLTNMYTVKLLRNEGLQSGEIAAKTGLHPFRVSTYENAVKNKKINRLERALHLISQADMQIKSSPLDSYTVLDRLVVRLCRV